MRPRIAAQHTSSGSTPCIAANQLCAHTHHIPAYLPTFRRPGLFNEHLLPSSSSSLHIVTTHIALACHSGSHQSHLVSLQFPSRVHNHFLSKSMLHASCCSLAREEDSAGTGVPPCTPCKYIVDARPTPTDGLPPPLLPLCQA